MKNKKNLIELFVILLLGLTPLLWFQGSEVILGHDAGLPLSPLTHFLDRLYAWTYRFGFGIDQSFAMPGFFIHGLEALITSFGASLQLQQKIVFIFWFTLPGLTMYYFARKIADRFQLHFFTLPVTVFYMYNHFLLQGWFIAERTKFSLYAALPLVLGLLFEWQEKKRGTLVTSIFISLIFFFLNGAGSLPLFGGILLMVAVFIFFYFFSSFTKKKVFELLKLFGFVILFSFFLNAYWLLPFIYFVSNAYGEAVQSAGGVNGIIGWLSYISENSSLINLFRLQGIPEWYQNPLHPFANGYLSNPVLVFVSILLPITAFASLRLVNDQRLKNYVYFFAVLALFSMVFVGGSHPPFGALYVLFVKVIPGFIAFRTPFYKFAPALWFAYAVLIGFTLNYLLQYLYTRWKKISYIFYGIILFAIIGYSYPFLTGSFFNYIVGERTMKVEVPQYVFDFRDWSDTAERKEIKTFVLPPPSEGMFVDAYTWKYWSLSPVPSLLTNAPIVSISSYMKEDERKLMYLLAYKIKTNDPSWKNLAKLLNISSFLVRNDFAWNLKGSLTDDPQLYTNVLRNTEGVKHIKKFGEWDVYSLNGIEGKNINVYPALHYVQGSIVDLTKVAADPEFNDQAAFYVSDSPATNKEQLLADASKIYIAPHCVMCSLIFPFLNEDLYIPTFTPDSFLYPLLSQKEKKIEQALPSVKEKVNYYADQSLKDEKGVERVIIEEKSNEAIKLSFTKYAETIEKLHQNLTELAQENDIHNNDALFKAYNLLRIQRKVIIGKLSDTLSELDIQKFNNFYDVFEQTYLLSKNSAWYTSTLSDKKSLFDVPRDETYTLLVKKSTLSDPDAARQFITYKIDGKAYQINAQQEEKGWYQSDPLILQKGTYTLEMQDAPLKNLFSQAPQTLSLNANASKISCYNSPIFPAETGQVFRLSFQYNQLTDHGKFFYIVLQAHEVIPILSDKGANLMKVTNWTREESDYIANNNDGIRFVICNRLEDTTYDSDAVVEIKDIELYRMTEPEVILTTSTDLRKQQSSVHVLTAEQTNTKITIQTDQQFTNHILALNTTFNQGWTLQDVQANKFVVNGYANGWYITDDLKNITIKYIPQKLVIIGFTMSGISVAFLLGLIIVLRKKRKHD